MPERTSQLVSSRPASLLRWLAAAEMGLIFLVFFLHAGWPVPEVNEPHYLAKARHYWNSQWCADDFFLESKDAHHVFYWSFGWLTLWLPLPAVAWIGRVLTWGLLAWAWRRASVAVTRRPLFSVLSAAVFISLLQLYNFAGEWVVGGVEAKGFAYVFVLLGIEALLRNRWNRTWLLLGAAAAFHVLVGGWSILAAAVVWLFSGKRRPPLRGMLPALAGGFLLSLIALIPGLALSQGQPPEVVNEANQIYVFHRIPHHLAPFTLGPDRFAKRAKNNAILLGTFIALMLLLPRRARLYRLESFVLATLIFAVTGLAIGFVFQSQPDIAAKLLRYYWFRVYDVALPLGVALLAVALLARLQNKQRVAAVVWLAVLLAVPIYHLGNVMITRSLDHRAPADRKMRSVEIWKSMKVTADGELVDNPSIDQQTRTLLLEKAADDWQACCRWVAENTPEDARFLTPRASSSFKWHASRTEVVIYKDVPQDANNLVEWQRRMDEVHGNRGLGSSRYSKTLAHQGVPRLRELGRKYQADYMVCSTLVALRLPILFQQGSYAVYQLSEPSAKSTTVPDLPGQSDGDKASAQGATHRENL